MKRYCYKKNSKSYHLLSHFWHSYCQLGKQKLFTDNGPEKRAAVVLKNGGKCLEGTVIAFDGKDMPFRSIVSSVR